MKRNAWRPKSWRDFGKKPAKNRRATVNFQLPKSWLELGLIHARNCSGKGNSRQLKFRLDIAVVPVKNRCGRQNSRPRSQQVSLKKFVTECWREANLLGRDPCENHNEILLTEVQVNGWDVLHLFIPCRDFLIPPPVLKQLTNSKTFRNIC